MNFVGVSACPGLLRKMPSSPTTRATSTTLTPPSTLFADRRMWCASDAPASPRICADCARCRIVVLTLGLVEVWYDRKDRFIFERDFAAIPYGGRLGPLRSSSAQLCRLPAGIGRGVGPPASSRTSRRNQIFLSVSPVPLAATFTSRDVLTANTYSKSTQMAAACDFAERHDNVHYVPSY